MTENITAIADAKRPEPMTHIKIGKREYKLYLGFDFIRKLDKIYPDGVSGLEFGNGVGQTLVGLSQGSALAVLNFITAATYTESKPPTEKDIEKALDDYDVEELCENFTQLLETSSTTKAQLRYFEKIGRELAAQQAEQAKAQAEATKSNLS